MILLINQLQAFLKKIANLESILGILEWDQQVNLPIGAHPFRSSQTSAMTEVVHLENTSASLGQLLESIHARFDELNEEERVVFTHASKKYERLIKIPPSFAAKKAKSQSEAYQKWISARENNDFSLFEPCLIEQIQLCQEEAAYVGSHSSAYEYFVDQFDDGMDVDTIDRLFQPLGVALAELIPPLVERQREYAQLKLNDFSTENQRLFLKEVVASMGFDFDRGRIDESVHPFCAGSGQDIRMTTRFIENNPLDSLYSAIHETGHALYEQGLRVEEFGNALGAYAGMAVHESQSRLWENQVARSESFWVHWEKRYRELFSASLSGLSMQDWLRKVMEVRCIPIRVDSDEVTYNLHIIIRYELERALFDGVLSVKDLPLAWNDLYEKYLGIRPESDQVGVLQDVHWATGAFGYFPSYAMGNIISAQLWNKLQLLNPDLDQDIERGDYQSILTWLRSNIHRHGRKYTTQQLVQVATGESISEQPLIDYLKKKYYGFFEITE